MSFLGVDSRTNNGIMNETEMRRMLTRTAITTEIKMKKTTVMSSTESNTKVTTIVTTQTVTVTPCTMIVIMKQKMAKKNATNAWTA